MKTIAILLSALLGLAQWSAAVAQKKDDCSQYTGVEKEACEKLARKKR